MNGITPTCLSKWLMVRTARDPKSPHLTPPCKEGGKGLRSWRKSVEGEVYKANLLTWFCAFSPPPGNLVQARRYCLWTQNRKAGRAGRTYSGAMARVHKSAQARMFTEAYKGKTWQQLTRPPISRRIPNKCRLLQPIERDIERIRKHTHRYQ